ncbi:hypothetical protein VNO78_23812 [Psophocarpus tetragonolobus]|uniref:Homeobox-leucine zipper protein n=1 Tax=Psophocarpus tetragonolobus TaxID=3891 RepID=A0AAN9XEC1_PSOTE
MANQTTSHPLFLSSASRSIMSFDNGDYYFYQPQKKRRLSTNQVQFLEKSFDQENKLEPERKSKLAKDLGLQPRQVAIWFQNRRARWKTKQLEQDYHTLHHTYQTLKANYDILLKEKQNLQAQVASLTEKVVSRGESEAKEEAEKRESKVCCTLQEDISWGRNTDILDSNSPDGVHSPHAHADSSHVFEPDHSDLSQDEEDDLTNTVLYPSHLFSKLEHLHYSHQTCSNFGFGFPDEDQPLWTWPY